MLLQFQVDNRKNQVVAAGPDKAVPVVTGVRKLRNDRLTERRVFVEGEALADKVKDANFHELKRIYANRSVS